MTPPALVPLEKHTAAVTFTLSLLLECLVTSEAQDQDKSLTTLESDVYQRKEKHGPNDVWWEDHLHDGNAQLDVLTSCLHGDGPAAS